MLLYSGMQEIYDAVVVGAGPSGMMAAGQIAKMGHKVLLLEKEREVGKKLSITGGGRCNITHAEFDNNKLLTNYGDAKKFLYSPFSRFAVRDTYSFFEKHKLPLVEEARKRVFPKTQKATDVTEVMLNFIQKQGVELRLNCLVKTIKKNEEKDIFQVILSNKEVISARTVVFATGGPSGKTLSKEIPRSWSILIKLGHSINPPSPDLVPLTTKAKFVHRLSGLSMSFVALRFKQEEKTRFKKIGKILFTHFGVSGPTIINSSKEALSLLRKTGKLTLSVDFFPDTDFDKLDRRLLSLISKNKNKKFRNTLSGLLPDELAKTIIYIVDKNKIEIKSADVDREFRRDVVHKMKDFFFNITGSMGLDWAIVADGGVPLQEVDTKTMQSSKIPGLFLTGDVLDINRPSGGFSLQLCWTTGYVAALGAHEYLLS